MAYETHKFIGAVTNVQVKNKLIFN